MGKETKILIVDDDVLIAEHLKEILSAFGYSDIRLAHNKIDALASIASFSPDIALLDIRMEGERDGIEIGHAIKTQFQFPFIFITAHSDKEMIKAAAQERPSGYVTKPFKKADVYAAVSIALESVQSKNTVYFSFKDGYSDTRIDVDDIIYAESEGNYINLFTARKRFLLRNSLEWLLENLPAEQFIRVHRSYAINNKRIEKISSQNVVVSGKEIPVSRNKIKDLRKVFLSL